MIDPRRHLLGAACFLLGAVLVLSYDFEDRGRHLDTPSAMAKTDRAGVYDLSKARMLMRVVGHIRSHYVDPDRVDPRQMATAALQAVQTKVPEVRVVVDRDGRGRPKRLEVSVAEATREFALDRVGDLYELNWKLMDVFDFLERNLPVTADLEDIEYTATNGLLSTLDPHSVLITPQAYREMQLGTQGRFGGLGIVVSVREGLLTVMSVMDGTPAARAGLLSGDQIARIGEESTINMALGEAVNRLRGEPGTSIAVWIKRKGWTEAKPYTLTREEIRLRSVVHDDLGQGIGYVKIRNFQGNTADDLEEALTKLMAGGRKLNGLVLDLRDNPGGLLDQAIRVSDRFISDGTLVTTVRERGKEREERHATRAGTLDDVPMVVLVNRGSASASEIVAGALKHDERALIIGTTSFGKGSVQVVYQLDDAALKLTIAQYLTPGDISIQSVGIVPDVEIDALSVDAGHLNLHADEQDLRGEAGLDSHLESKKITDVKPSVRLELLQTEAEAEARGGEEDDAPSHDTLTMLARDLLVAAPAVGRRQALVQAKGFLDARQAAEDQRVVTALGALGVDWQRATGKGTPKLRAELTLVPPEGRPAGARIRAGDTVTIRATVRNEGRTPASRIHGVLHSGIGPIAGRELVFGRIEPGAQATWSTEIALPRSLAAQGDAVRLELFSDDRSLGEDADDQARLMVEMDSQPEPRFSYSARVVDAQGSGDGLVQRGERFDLVVDVTNVGEGDADDVLLTVKNESGEAVFIERGRERVGKLAAGASARTRFRLSVKPTLKSQDVQLLLRIVDQGLREWTEDSLSLPVFPQEFPPGVKSRWLGEVAAGPVAAHAGAHRETDVVAQVSAGAVLPVVTVAGDWAGVALEANDGDEATGWVPLSSLTRREGVAARYAGVQVVPRHEPPALGIPNAHRTLVTSDASLDLAGTARFAGEGPGRRYVYVYRGNDKVFFKAGGGAEGPRDAMDFATSIPLEPGRNELVVVAREGDEDVTRHSFAVFRTGKAK
ncbi:MAG: PDZ domain-containing protein [Deltaproteobacteria bacterium]|nr:PDZ domain-containing protein [Deltaproteobacteria bacterium]MCB9785585.1 PDZ domain-containing protein [Deltaproteobacteria bacterium]